MRRPRPHSATLQPRHQLQEEVQKITDAITASKTAHTHAKARRLQLLSANRSLHSQILLALERILALTRAQHAFPHSCPLELLEPAAPPVAAPQLPMPPGGDRGSAWSPTDPRRAAWPVESGRAPLRSARHGVRATGAAALHITSGRGAPPPAPLLPNPPVRTVPYGSQCFQTSQQPPLHAYANAALHADDIMLDAQPQPAAAATVHSSPDAAGGPPLQHTPKAAGSGGKGPRERTVAQQAEMITARLDSLQLMATVAAGVHLRHGSGGSCRARM